MSERRKKVGKLIQRTRRARFRSAKAYAAHLGISPTSVTRAENGWDTTGEAVYSAIEGDLGWAENSIMDYVEGRTDTLPGDDKQADDNVPTFRPTDKDRARWRTMTLGQIRDEADMIGRTISERMRTLYLQAARAELENIAPESPEAQTSDKSAT